MLLLEKIESRGRLFGGLIFFFLFSIYLVAKSKKVEKGLGRLNGNNHNRNDMGRKDMEIPLPPPSICG